MAVDQEILEIVLRLQNLPAFRAGLKAAARELDGVSKSTSRVNVWAQRSNRSMQQMGKMMAYAGGIATVALGYGLYKATNLAADFEAQLSALGAVSGATGRQMDLLRRQALEQGAATKYSALEAAAAQTELAKGGLSTEDILGGGLESALALAAAGEMDLAMAAGTAVDAMGLFGLRGRDAMRVADALATAANITTGEVSDFAIALRQGGSAARLVGMDLETTIGWLEALARVGVRGSDAGTSMRAALSYISASRRSKEAQADLGISFFDLQGRIKPLPEMANELRRSLSGLGHEQRMMNLTNLAGTDGMRALAALYTAGSRELVRYIDANRRAGTAADVAARKQDNFKGRLERFRGALETLGIVLGTELLPVAEDVVEGLTDIVEAASRRGVIDAFADAIGAAVDVIAGGVDFAIDFAQGLERGEFWAMALATIISGPLVGALGLYIVGLIRAVALQVALIATNPATWIAMAVVGFVLLYTKVRWFRDAVHDVWNWIKNNWALITGPIALPFTLLAMTVIFVVDRIRGITSTFIDWVKAAWNAPLAQALRAPWVGLGGFVFDIVSGVMRSIDDIVNFGIDRLNNLIDVFNATAAHLPGVDSIGKIDHIGQQGVDDRIRESIDRGRSLRGRAFDFNNPLLVDPFRRRRPGMADGGTVMSAGAAWVGERGPELLTFPRGAQVTPLISERPSASIRPLPARSAVSGMDARAGDGGTYVLQLVLDRRVIAEAVFDEARRKAARR